MNQQDKEDQLDPQAPGAVDQQQRQQNNTGAGAASNPGKSPAPRKEGEQTRDVLVDEVNQDQASTQQDSGDSPAPSGERSEPVLPRVEGEETRDVLADEVSEDGEPTQEPQPQKQQQKQQQEQEQRQQQQQQQDNGGSSSPAGERSESLLPKAEGEDTPQVAEEVSLDQQSDRVRGLGNLPADDVKTPAGSVADAVAGTLGASQGQDGTPEADNTVPRE